MSEEFHGVVVIARSKATKQSKAGAPTLDCFALWTRSDGSRLAAA